jgi:release factor glutamine methyltransferase
VSIPVHPAGVAGQLRVAANLLSAVSDTPRLDAELLLAHALDIDRSVLLLDPARHDVPELYAELIARRLGHEPVAYIIGHQDFRTIRLMVGPGVLIPRSDSEVLIDAAVAHFGELGPRRILDLGTGPGTLLLAALDHWPGAMGLGIDRMPVALDYARDNALALGMSARARFQQGGWADGGRADLVLCNPPYVEDGALLDRQVRDYEPPEALFAGPDGLDDYRALLPLLPDHLEPDGLALVEIGAAQAAAVVELARKVGFRHIAVGQDLAGRDRFVALCVD